MKSEPAESAQQVGMCERFGNSWFPLHQELHPKKDNCLNWELAASQPTQPEGMRSVWGLHCNISSNESTQPELHNNDRDRGEKMFGKIPAAQIVAEGTTAWRVGRKVGRTIYRGDELIGLMDTPELAQQVVKGQQEGAALRGEIARFKRLLAEIRELNPIKISRERRNKYAEFGKSEPTFDEGIVDALAEVERLTALTNEQNSNQEG